jgi:hypothetical protein
MASDERIRTTHIGSLPRPPELLDLFEKRQDGAGVDPRAFAPRPGALATKFMSWYDIPRT